MERVPKIISQPTHVVRHEFQPSSRLAAATRSFLTEAATYATYRYKTQKSALLDERQIEAFVQDGTFRKLTDMARNEEVHIYPNGEVTLNMSARAIMLSFEFSGGPLEALQRIGNRLENLDDPDLGPSSAQDTIFTTFPKAYLGSESQVEDAKLAFREVMNDEFKFRYYEFKPMKLVGTKIE